MNGPEDIEAPSRRNAVAADMRRWTIGNLRYVADLFLPPVCIRCHAPISTHGVLCAACWQGINFIMPPLCSRLGLPLPMRAARSPLYHPWRSVIHRLTAARGRRRASTA